MTRTLESLKCAKQGLASGFRIPMPGFRTKHEMKIRCLPSLCIGIIALIASLSASADTLYLRSGTTIEGVFVGATSREVQFKGSDGVAKRYSVSNIEALEFTEPPPAPPKAAKPGSTVVIPANTTITVRTIDNIDSSQTSPGQRFRAGIDDPVVVGDQVIIPRGANCTVQVVQVQENKEMALKLSDITVRGKSYDVAANYAQLEAQGTSKTKKGVKRGALLGGLGAAIGGIAGGGSGAAIGAVSGVGLGAISATMAKGKTLKVPAETRLIFQLRSSLPLS